MKRLRGQVVRAVEVRPWAVAVAVAAVAVAVYGNSLTNGFTLDDVWIISRNERAHDLADFRAIWLTPYWRGLGETLGLYRPLAIFIYAVQWAISDGSPILFHAVNVGLHAGISVLVFLLLRRLVSTGGAAVGALVFAVHPVHTEAVANVVGQAELLVAAALLVACYLHVTRPEGPEISRKRAGVIALLYGAGLLMKEHAAVLPGLLVILDVYQRRVRLDGESLRRYARAMAVPILVLIAVFGAFVNLRLQVLGTIAGTDANPALPYLRGEHRLLSAFRAWPEYARLLIFPADLSSDYSPAVVLPVESLTPMAALGAVLLGATVAMALLLPVHSAAGLVAAWFLVAVLPVSNLLFPIGVLLAERTLYLPSVAVAAMAAFLWREGVHGVGRRRVRIGMGVMVIVVTSVMGWRTLMRNPDWRNNAAMQWALVRDHPESYRAQWFAGINALFRGDTTEAAKRWTLAHRIWPEDPGFLVMYAAVEMSFGNNEKAVNLMEAVEARHPDQAKILRTLALAYNRAGRHDETLATLDRLFALAGPDEMGYQLRAFSQTELGRLDEAATAWRAYVRITDGDKWSGWLLLADVEARRGRFGDALAAIDRGLKAPDLDSTAVEALEGTRTRILERASVDGPMPLDVPYAPLDLLVESPVDPLLRRDSVEAATAR